MLAVASAPLLPAWRRVTGVFLLVAAATAAVVAGSDGAPLSVVALGAVTVLARVLAPTDVGNHEFRDWRAPSGSVDDHEHPSAQCSPGACRRGRGMDKGRRGGRGGDIGLASHLPFSWSRLLQEIAKIALKRTDGDPETWLIHRRVDLPDFAAFPLLESDDGRALLAEYSRDHVVVAARTGAGIVLETPTWRAIAAGDRGSDTTPTVSTASTVRRFRSCATWAVSPCTEVIGGGPATRSGDDDLRWRVSR